MGSEHPNACAKIGGFLDVGNLSNGDVVINHPRIDQDENGGHIVFSPAQARELAGLLLKKADEGDQIVADARDEACGVAVVMNGKFVIVNDSTAVAVARAVEKHNCRNLLALNDERVRHFIDRIGQRSDLPDQVVITLINVDNPNGGLIAAALMPGVDWQQFRDRGEVPVARGLAARSGMEDALEVFDEEAAEKLRAIKGEVPIVVVDRGVAEVFTLDDLSDQRD